MLTEKVIINDDDEDKEKKLHVVIDAENVDKLEIKDKEIKDEERPKDIHVIIDKAEPEAQWGRLTPFYPKALERLQ